MEAVVATVWRTSGAQPSDGAWLMNAPTPLALNPG